MTSDLNVTHSTRKRRKVKSGFHEGGTRRRSEFETWQEVVDDCAIRNNKSRRTIGYDQIMRDVFVPSSRSTAAEYVESLSGTFFQRVHLELVALRAGLSVDLVWL